MRPKTRKIYNEIVHVLSQLADDFGYAWYDTGQVAIRVRKGLVVDESEVNNNKVLHVLRLLQEESKIDRRGAGKARWRWVTPAERLEKKTRDLQAQSDEHIVERLRAIGIDVSDSYARRVRVRVADLEKVLMILDTHPQLRMVLWPQEGEAIVFEDQPALSEGQRRFGNG